MDEDEVARLRVLIEEVARRLDLLERQVAHFLPKGKRAPDEETED